MNDVVPVYGETYTYKDIEGPDGARMNKLNCIGWVYDYGYQDESLIGRESVSNDITDVIQDIIDWEWDNDSDVMIGTIASTVYKSIGQLKTALKDIKERDIKDNEIIPLLVSDLYKQKYDI